EDWQETYVSAPDLSSRTGYSRYMTAPLILDKGERRSVDLFPSRDMFPEGFGKGYEVNYFLPLHFSERCLGYYIITNSDFPISSLLCHTLTMDLSISMENIRKLCHINKAMDELNRLYVIDPLCNIYNRNGFFNIAENLFKESIAHHNKVLISFIDMDGLKYINDNFGHKEGDYALQHLARIIKDCCKSGRICARFGGDEFIIFGDNACDEDIDALESVFNVQLKNMNRLIHKPYELDASIGTIVTEVNDETSLFNLITQADEIMYERKKRKRTSRYLRHD
ncbi:GGDEF domain-containing protein, partial [Ruminococcus sp.]|uniref:GGDEF domain-containing protein n=1 Tax=Ruminococcus sp. TaxID=41978 RepID=UPI0025E44E5D